MTTNVSRKKAGRPAKPEKPEAREALSRVRYDTELQEGSVRRSWLLWYNQRLVLAD